MKINLLTLFFLCFIISSAQELNDNRVLLKQIVLTGQYEPTHIDSSIYPVEIIKKEALKNFGAQNLSSVLNRQIGVDIFHDPFLGNYINFQGFSGENIKVLIDGVEMSGLQNGSVDFGQIQMNNIERIEIIDGPLSTIYGNNALGGTINLISKVSQAEKFNASIESYLESIGQYNININAGYKRGKNTFFTSFGRHYFDGWTPDDTFSLFLQEYSADSTRFHAWKPKTQWFFKQNAIYKTNNNLIIKPYVDFLFEELVNKGLPQGAFAHYAFDEYYTTQRFDKGILVKGPFFNRNIDVLFHHNRYNRIKNQYYIDLTNLSTSLTDNIDTTIVDLFTHRVTCSNIQNTKLNYQYGYSLNAEELNTNRVFDSQQKRTDFSWFSSLDYHLNKFHIRAALRYIYSNSNEDKLTPALNLKFDFDETYLRLSYAHGFRTPSLKEMYLNFIDMNHNIQGNPNLNSEYSKNMQLNLSSKFFNNSDLNLKFFYNQITNFITLLQNDNTANFEYANIGDYKNMGAKLGFKFNIINSDLNFNMSYLGQSSIYDPDLNFHLALNLVAKYDINSKNTISIFYGLKSPRSIISKNSYGEIIATKIDSYHMLDFSYDISIFEELLDFSIGCNNIFNLTNIDSETLISSFHNNDSSGIPLSCGRYVFTSLKINLTYE